MPPFRSKDSLAGWLKEFEKLGYPTDAHPRVIEQDGSQGANTGLVAARLTGGLDIYIQPAVEGGANWVVTIDSREEATELSPADVARLSTELATVAALCTFLEQKSLALGES